MEARFLHFPPTDKMSCVYIIQYWEQSLKAVQKDTFKITTDKSNCNSKKCSRTHRKVGIRKKVSKKQKAQTQKKDKKSRCKAKNINNYFKYKRYISIKRKILAVWFKNMTQPYTVYKKLATSITV